MASAVVLKPSDPIEDVSADETLPAPAYVKPAPVKPTTGGSGGRSKGDGT